MFKAYFEDLVDIGDIDTIVRVGLESGLPESELRTSLESAAYRAKVDEGIRWAHEVGVSAVPTFVLGGRFGIVGAQDISVFEDVLQSRLNRQPSH